MAINTYFQQIQRVLADPSDQGQNMRQKVAQTAGVAQAAAGALAACSAVIILASAISCVAHPILGAFGLMVGATTLLTSYESFIIARNVQVVARGAIANLVNRVMNALRSPDAFVASILKDTLVADALLREFIVEKLTQQVVV